MSIKSFLFSTPNLSRNFGEQKVLSRPPFSKNCLTYHPASSYASSRNDSSFLSYFASTTPDSEHKRVRLKTILLLAGSSLYDPEIIRQRLLEREKALKLELAIIDGKVCMAFLIRRHATFLILILHLSSENIVQPYKFSFMT